MIAANYLPRLIDGWLSELLAQLPALMLTGPRAAGRATAAPSAGDAAHLRFLRDQLDERFLGGAVLHTGPRAFTLSERIYALPICCLWG